MFAGHFCASWTYRVACAVRYFWVALLRLRLSSLDKVPEPGVPTPLTATPWPPFAIETALFSLAKLQLKLFMCVDCDSILLIRDLVGFVAEDYFLQRNCRCDLQNAAI